MAQTLRRFGRFDALLLTSGLWFLAKFFRYAFPPLFPTFQVEYGVSNALLGTAFSALMLAYAGMQFPSGALADRFGSVRIIVAGGAVTATTGLLLAVKAPLLVVLAGMVLVGLGTGVHKTVAIRLLSRTYPARTGRSLGIFDTFGSFGGVAAPAVVVVLTDLAGWQMLFFAGGLVGGSLLVGFIRRVPARVGDDGLGPPAEDAPSAGGLARYRPLFAEPTFLAFVAVNALFGFAFNGTVAFLPLFLAEGTGLSQSVANLLYSAFFAVSLVQVVTGDLSDRLGSRVVMTATLVLATVGLAGLLVATGPILAGAFVVAVGLGCHGFRPVRGAYLVQLVPESVAGGSMGIVRTILMGAGAISPAIVGYLSDSVGYMPAFSLLAAVMGAAVVAVGVLSALD